MRAAARRIADSPNRGDAQGREVGLRRVLACKAGFYRPGALRAVVVRFKS